MAQGVWDIAPTVVGPFGATGAPVTITPSAPSATKVSGTLYIDNASQLGFQGYFGFDGNDVAAIPYSYKVK